MTTELRGRRALVTGATSGIGRAVAAKLAEKVEENLGGDGITLAVAPTPLGRAGEPEEIAEAVLFLAT